MSTYCIGDVQGCFDQLQALINKIQFDPIQDKLWFTGDLINRGPKSLAVLRWIKSLGEQAIVVLGNHDLHLLAVASKQAEIKSMDTLTEILQAPDCQVLCDWLRHQPLLHHDPRLDYVMVHAGLAPQWDLAKAQQCAREVETVLQNDKHTNFLSHMYGNEPDCWDDKLVGWERLRVITNYFTRLRFCAPDGTMDLNAKEGLQAAPKGYQPWFKLSNRCHKDLKIVFGHWAALEGKADESNVYALDTGCVWGRRLTALRLEDQMYFSVDCSRFEM